MADDGARKVSVSRTMRAPAQAIFDVLADPSMHSGFDGSGTVKGVQRRGAHQRLELGSKFTMHMRMGIGYRIRNKVVELEEDQVIAWTHLGGHRWRYELLPWGDGTETRVTETFDWSTSKVPWFIEAVGYPRRHIPNMERTLDRLAAIVEAGRTPRM